MAYGRRVRAILLLPIATGRGNNELHQRNCCLESQEKKSSKKVGQAWEEAAWSSGGSSLHGGIQHLKGQGPKQTDLIFEWLLLPPLAGQLARLVRQSKYPPLDLE